MHETPSQIVWRLHGSPRVDECGDASGRCFVCGGTMSRGRRVLDWLSTNFTDSNRARTPSATYVCEPCVYVQSRTAPVLGRPPGDCKVCDGSGTVVRIPPKGKGKTAQVGDPCPKCDGDGAATFGGNFRNYTSLYEEGWESPPFAPVKDKNGKILRYNGPSGLGYVNASKGEKPLIREFLRREHVGSWFAGIADSGQKHVLPFTPMNARGRSGMVLFDEQLVRVPSSFDLLDAMTDVLNDGITKYELERGEYYVRTMRENRARALWFEQEFGIRERGSAWFTLALWLAQRDEDEHERRNQKKGGDAGRRDVAVPAERVPARTERATADELLDPDTGPRSRCRKADHDRKRVGRSDAAPAPDREPQQGRLPGFD